MRLFIDILGLVFLFATICACDDGSGSPAPDLTEARIDDADAPAELPFPDGVDAPAELPPADVKDEVVADTLRDASEAEVAPADPLRFLNKLVSPGNHVRLRSDQGSVKFLLPVEGATPRPPLVESCYFQNMNVFEWHITFLHSFEELSALDFQEYTELVLYRDTRIWWGGDVRVWPGTPHPLTGEIGVVTFSIYADAVAGSPLEEADILAVDALLRRCAPFAVPMLVFVPTDAHQQGMVRPLLDSLSSEGVGVVFPEELHDALPATPYSLGVGQGVLRILEEGAPVSEVLLGDIVLASSPPGTPLEMTGLLTAEPQDPSAAVNLLMVANAAPNARLTGVYQNAYVRALSALPVQLSVEQTRTVLEAQPSEAQ